MLTKFPRTEGRSWPPLLALGTDRDGVQRPGRRPVADQQSDAAVNTELGTDPITLEMYAETGFPLAKALAEEFTKQHPNVKFNIREDQFTVIVRTRRG